MSLLIDVIQDLSLARDIDKIREIVSHAARELTGADGATFVLRDGDRCYYVDEDAIEPLWKGRRFPITACISGWAMLNRKSVVIPDIYVDTRIPADAYRPTFVKSLAMVPVRTSAPIGAIGNYWASPHHATDDEVALLQALADSASIAIQNALLYEQLRAAKETAENASRLKDEFLAMISHELRTPLIPIVYWSGAMLESDFPIDDLAEASKTIHESATRQQELVDDMLDMSGIVSGQMSLELVATDLRKAVGAATESLVAAAAAKGVQIVRVPTVVDCFVLGNDRKLQQISWNLLSNAVKFTPPGGEVRISVGRTTTHVVLVVADTGIGITPDFLPHAFDPFLQADGSLTRKFGGLGLGLAIVRNLVELHGGTVRAESAGRDLGATFTVSLPIPTLKDVAGSTNGQNLTMDGPRQVLERMFHEQQEAAAA